MGFTDGFGRAFGFGASVGTTVPDLVSCVPQCCIPGFTDGFGSAVGFGASVGPPGALCGATGNVISRGGGFFLHETAFPECIFAGEGLSTNLTLILWAGPCDEM